ncbi:hypothetical protein, partial [Mesorhizobium amorphae]|uniref:hypothetical protein n=1 Tax=Mesorhizobium amorphae TaxID=71433 RepID=UPI001FEF6950
PRLISLSAVPSRPTSDNVTAPAVVILVLALCLYLCRYHLLAIETAYVRGTRSNTLAQTPLWLPMVVFVAGLVIFMIQLLAYALRLLGGGALIRDNHESA